MPYLETLRALVVDLGTRLTAMESVAARADGFEGHRKTSVDDIGQDGRTLAQGSRQGIGGPAALRALPPLLRCEGAGGVLPGEG